MKYIKSLRNSSQRSRRSQKHEGERVKKTQPNPLPHTITMEMQCKLYFHESVQDVKTKGSYFLGDRLIEKKLAHLLCNRNVVLVVRR